MTFILASFATEFATALDGVGRFIGDGGVFMLCLVALSLLSVSVIVYKALTLRERNVVPEEAQEALSAAGRPDMVQVQGSLPMARNGDGKIDLDETMAAVPPLVDAGITDFKAFVRLGGGHDQTVEELAPLVTAFRQAVGRG